MLLLNDDYYLRFVLSLKVYLSNRAAAWMMVKRFAEARRDCRRATQLNSEYSKAYVRWGRCALSLGDLKDAEGAFCKVPMRSKGKEATQADEGLKQVRDVHRLLQQTRGACYYFILCQCMTEYFTNLMLLLNEYNF